jgi:RNA polymerase sigma-70 factor, ECF subfamily
MGRGWTVALRQEEFTRLCDDVDLDRDRILVERCQAGDAGAFGSLYARYNARLLRFCLRRLNDRHEAEDAAQEAFARAWKALPNFAGERRFYPWLTVIAGNICTDMLRRRSRSTPTEDVELGSRPPLGVTSDATADEMIIAAADGELAHRALDRLSVRHRHVLALREDSGWTYQQIADHEGVEIGTIETLLWRARQALKREFLALSESKGSFAGFLLGVGATIRTVVMRSAHRAAALQPGSSGGAFRNAFAGFAVTSAVAAAFIAPHALDSSHQSPVPLPAPAAAAGTSGAGTSAASGTRLAASVTPNAGSASGRSTTLSGAHAQGGGSDSAGAGTIAGADRSLDASGGALLSGASKSAAPVGGLAAPAQSLLPQELLEPILGASSLLSRTAAAATGASGSGSGSGSAPSVTSLVPAAVGALSTTVAGVSSAVASATGSSSATPQLGSPVSSPATTATPKSTTTTTAPLSGIASLTPNVFSALLGNG